MRSGMTSRWNGVVLAGLLLPALGLGGCAGCGGSATPEPENSSTSSSGNAVSGGSNGNAGTSGASSGTATSGASSGAQSGMSGSMGMGSSGVQDTVPTLAFTAPANDGTTVTAPIALDASVTFTAIITDDMPAVASGVAWTLTPPTGTPGSPSAGTLTGNETSFQAAFNAAGTWTVRVSYSDGVNPAVSATLTAEVYADLPPALSWIAPANMAGAVTGARRVGTQLQFQASLADDATLLQQNITWTHARPGLMAVTSQGNIIATGQNQARLEFTAELAVEGMHTITVAYSDGTNTRSLALTVTVLADLPATLAFTAPAHANGAVTVPVAVGDSLQFNVTLSDDTAIIPQNGTFTVVSPSGMQSNQGTINANGNSAAASLTVSFDAAGSWRVDYTYTDTAGQAVTISVVITVAQDPAPAVTITEPANDGTRVTAEVRENGAVTFRGRIQDNQPVAAQNILWTYTPQGGTAQTSQGTITGAGNTVTSQLVIASAGPAGTATVSLRYTDAGGSSTSATLQVPVTSAAAPSVVITAPANDGQTADNPVRVNTAITFRADVLDDAAIVSSGLQWTLTSPGGASTTNPGGFTPGMTANTGEATFTASLVAAGSWTVTARYVDATGLARSASILVQAQANAAPTCAFVNPMACLAAGQHTMRVTLDDADNDVPVTATIQSSNAADMVGNTTITWDGQNNPTRNVTITLAAGARTLTCTPTDDTGVTGTPATLAITTVAAPTVSISAPVDGNIIAAGGMLTYDVNATSDAAAAPVTVTLVDSMAGTLALDANLGGTLASPAPGIHELVAEVSDMCGGNVQDTVRYAVTTGGAPVASLGAAVAVQGVVLDVRALVLDGNGGLVAATSGNNNADALYAVNAAGPTATSYEPNVHADGDDVQGTQDAVTAARVGGTSTLGGRWEAYATSGSGLYLCAFPVAEMARCRNYQEGDGVGNGAQFRSDNVVDVVLLGGGTLPGESMVVVAFQDRVQVFAPQFVSGQVTMARVADIPRGDNDTSIPGEVQVLAGVSFQAGPPSVSVFWVGTNEGAHHVTITGGMNGMRTIQHFDADRPVQNNNAWPDFDVRAIAVDPANPAETWFALDQGMGHHAGPGFAITDFDGFRGTTGGNIQGSTSMAVDRHPDAQRPILWVGTGNAGFWRIDPSADPPLGMNITTADGVGLPSNNVRSVAIIPGDTAHVKWVGTSQGLFGYRGQ